MKKANLLIVFASSALQLATAASFSSPGKRVSVAIKIERTGKLLVVKALAKNEARAAADCPSVHPAFFGTGWVSTTLSSLDSSFDATCVDENYPVAVFDANSLPNGCYVLRNIEQLRCPAANVPGLEHLFAGYEITETLGEHFYRNRTDTIDVVRDGNVVENYTRYLNAEDTRKNIGLSLLHYAVNGVAVGEGTAAVPYLSSVILTNLTPHSK